MKFIKDESSSNSRAESLRSRKTKQSERRFDVTTSRLGIFPVAEDSRPRRGQTHKQPAPTLPGRPVVVRNATFGTPIARQVATANPRRAVYVPINASGTEMRLPSLPRIQVGWRLLSATIFLVCAIGAFTLLLSPFFMVGPVQIKGIERLTTTDVEAALDLENLSIVEVDPAGVAQRLTKRFDGIESIQVKVGLPTAVTVTIKERTPVLAWQQEDNVQWVDTSGVLFTPTGSVDALPTISSPEKPRVVVDPVDTASSDETTADAKTSAVKQAKPVNAGPLRLQPQLLDAALKLIQRLPPGTTLVFTEAHGLGWEDPAGYDVYIGTDLTNFEEKYNMVQAIAANLTQKGIAPDLINAVNVDAPYFEGER